VNHIDTAPLYGDAEKRVGAWMDDHRGDFFIATKTRSRDYKRAWQDLQRSLERLRVDHVDLWQMHGLTNQAGWEKVMGPGGALEALVEARQKGLVSFLGVTGHGNKVPVLHLQSLERFNFDSVLLPYNYCQMQVPGYAADFLRLCQVCRERNVALQTIKSIARQPVLKQPGKYHTYFYEPLESRDAIEKSVHWAMGLPGSFVITAGDLSFVSGMLDVAEGFSARPSDEEMEKLMKEYDIRPVFK
jgi:aryl-alcohol dehydrogenase-like predicted oxidoreductase